MKVSKTEETYKRLVSLIDSGDLLPGDYINENRIAVEFKVNRSSVREALNQLIAEGIVEKKANRRKYVVNIQENENDLLMEFRASLESSAAWLAARNRDVEDLERLEQSIKDHSYFIKTKYLEAANEADRRFHNYVVEASKNPYLIETYKRGKIKLHIKLTVNFLKNEIEKTIPEHKEILNAIRDGNCLKASGLIWEHLLKA